MNKGPMIAMAMAAVGLATPAMAQTYQRGASDGPSRARYHSSDRTTAFRSAGSERADRFGDCMVRQDRANSALYARSKEGSRVSDSAAKALAPAFEACRAHLQNWARYDAHAIRYHRYAIGWAVHRLETSGT